MSAKRLSGHLEARESGHQTARLWTSLFQVLTKRVPTPGGQANQMRGGCLTGSGCSVNCVQSEPQQTSYYLLHLSIWGLSLNRCWSVGLGICWMSQ